jgi:DNA-binding MarR family transcriptional regulator
MARSIPRPPGDDVAVAMNQLRLLVGSLTRSARSIEAQTGITNAQLFVLRQLGDDDTLSVSDLARGAHTLQGTMSTVVARLVRAGLVKKRRSVADGRRAVLSLTPRGRRLLADAPAPPTEAVLNGLTALAPRAVRRLTEGLQALIDSLGLKAVATPMLFEEMPPRER